MYVVFESGGKQYRVRAQDKLAIEKIPYTEGKLLELSGVSFSENPEQPMTSVKIMAMPLELKKADKVIIFRKNRRHNYRRKKGHRQTHLHIRIEEIIPSTAAA